MSSLFFENCHSFVDVAQNLSHSRDYVGKEACLNDFDCYLRNADLKFCQGNYHEAIELY